MLKASDHNMHRGIIQRKAKRRAAANKYKTYYNTANDDFSDDLKNVLATVVCPRQREDSNSYWSECKVVVSFLTYALC